MTAAAIVAMDVIVMDVMVVDMSLRHRLRMIVMMMPVVIVAMMIMTMMIMPVTIMKMRAMLVIMRVAMVMGMRHGSSGCAGQRERGGRRLLGAQERGALDPDQTGAEQRDQAVAGDLHHLLGAAHGGRGGVEQDSTDPDDRDSDQRLHQARGE